MLVFILSLLASHGNAQERWLCTEEASQLQGSAIYACGVGLADNEADSRALALKRATDEFHSLCDMSEGCKGHKVTVEPKRTTCEDFQGKVRCYRGLTFTPTPELTREEVSNVIAKAKAKPLGALASIPSERLVLRKGMSKADLIAMLGNPFRVVPGTYMTSTMYMYRKTTPGCTGYFNCAVYLDDGKVSSYSDDWSLNVTDALEN